MVLTHFLKFPEYLLMLKINAYHFRGEKLYVTKDSRIKESKGRKYLWWFICLALVLALVIVAILAATGVIFAASPTTPVESRNFGDKEVNTAGFLGSSSNRTSNPPIPVPVADLTNAVPNAVTGQLTFKNMNFKPEYNDPKNPEFQRIAKSLARELQDVLQMNSDMDNVAVTIVDMK